MSQLVSNALCVQVLEYNTNLVATVVRSDPEGQDWANSKPYNAGEAVSAAVQFWWYHMQVRQTHYRLGGY